MKQYLRISCLLLTIACAPVIDAQDRSTSAILTPDKSRVLLVVAHPKDESEMAVTVYRIGKELLESSAWATAELRLQQPRRAPLFKIPDGRDQRIDIFTRIVERQRSAHGGFDTEPPENRLSAMVARTHSDTFQI